MSSNIFIRTAEITAACITALGMLALGGLSAMAETPPGLSITIDNGVTETAPDSDVSYDTMLTNLGTDAVTATVVLTVPAFASIDGAPDATVEGTNATWTVIVAPGSSTTMTATAHIGAIPNEEYRVTTLASVYLGETADGAPIIRSADSDKIPGVVDPKVGADDSAGETQDTPEIGWALPVIIGAGGLLLALTAVFILRRRVQRSQRTGRRSLES